MEKEKKTKKGNFEIKFRSQEETLSVSQPPRAHERNQSKLIESIANKRNNNPSSKDEQPKASPRAVRVTNLNRGLNA